MGSVPNDEVPRAEFEVIKTAVAPGTTRLSLRRPQRPTFPLRAGQYVQIRTQRPIQQTRLFQITDVGEGCADLWDESGSLWGEDVRTMVRVRQWLDENGSTVIEW